VSDLKVIHYLDLHALRDIGMRWHVPISKSVSCSFQIAPVLFPNGVWASNDGFPVG